MAKKTNILEILNSSPSVALLRARSCNLILAIKQLIIARSADKVPTNTSDVPINVDNSIQSADKVSITDEMADKLADIVIYLKNHPKSPSSSIATLIGLGDTSTKNYLRRLVSFGLVKAEGANKNRTYSAI